MDWIPLAALVVATVGLSGAAVWKIVTRTEDKLRDEIREAQAKNEKAHDGIVTRVDGLSTRVDGLSTRVDDLSTRVDDLSTRVDGLSTTLNAVARDVAFLAGRQAERDHRDSGGA